MKRYDNGEIVTASRMEDEEWYYTYYQPFISIAISSEANDVEELYQDVLATFKLHFEVDLSNQSERILRWCVLLFERIQMLRHGIDAKTEA